MGTFILLSSQQRQGKQTKMFPSTNLPKYHSVNFDLVSHLSLAPGQLTFMVQRIKHNTRNGNSIGTLMKSDRLGRWFIDLHKTVCTQAAKPGPVNNLRTIIPGTRGRQGRHPMKVQQDKGANTTGASKLWNTLNTFWKVRDIKSA